jgi:hypothetical protein
MKRIVYSFVALAGLGMVAASTPAFANADDAAWIKKCVADNKDEGAKASVVAAYCACMTEKMSSDETLSVTAWEKTHPTEQKACSKEAGWK